MPDKQYPLVTIITPSYNQGAFLEETIRSVINQDYPNIEYFIIDGKSSDNSIDIIKKYEGKITWWVSEPDTGQSHAILKGFEKANGKYITWLCSDDILEKSAISISVTFLEKYKDAALTFGNRTRIDALGNIITFSRKGSMNQYFLKNGITLPQETTLIRKEAYLKTEGIDTQLQMVMDFDLWCKLICTGSFVHIPAYLGRFRTHAENKSSMYSADFRKTGFKDGKPAEHARILKKHFKKAPSKPGKLIAGRLYNILIFLERRTKKYKQKKYLLIQIRSQL